MEKIFARNGIWYFILFSIIVYALSIFVDFEGFKYCTAALIVDLIAYFIGRLIAFKTSLFKGKREHVLIGSYALIFVILLIVVISII